MYTKYKDVDKNKFEELYTHKNRNEIQSILNISDHTYYKLIKELSLKKTDNFDIEKFKELYYDKTYKEIAKELNLTIDQISKIVKKYNIPKKGYKPTKYRGATLESLGLSRNEFIELYNNLKNSEVCQKLNISEDILLKLINLYNIPKKKDKYKRIFSKEEVLEIISMWKSDRHTILDIKEKFNIRDSSIIYRILKENEIKEVKARHRPTNKYKPPITKEKYIEIKDNMSKEDISAMVGGDAEYFKMINHFKKEYDIPFKKKVFPERGILYEFSEKIDVNSFEEDLKIKSWDIICKENSLSETTLRKLANHLNLQKTPKCNMEEKIIEDLNLPEDIKYSIRDRSIISKELDIYFPDYKFAIEYNGVLWHSRGTSFPNNFKNFNKRHLLEKTNECEKNNIQLYQIFDIEYNDPVKKEIWISMIKNRLGLSERIYARKCKILLPSKSEAKKFLNENHMQGGNVSNNLAFGLYYEDELVSLMTFGKSRFNKNYDYELLRFCNKRGIVVIGGASKLLNYFRKHYSGSIISFANRRWSNGSLYESLSFNRLRISAPNHFYYKNGNLFSRNSYQKHKLANKLKAFDVNLSGVHNMMNNNYRQLFDCGNIVYALD